VPLYEYACPGCGERFEKLVRRFGDAVSCPSCASPDVEKQLSVFAGCGGGACSPGGGCEGGPCGGGACPLD
jgi:putative FmdB family regulatory protein